MRRAEVISPRQIDELGSEFHFTAFEETDVVDLVQQVTRFASLHDPVLIVVAFEDVAQALIVNRDTAHPGRAFENLRERGRRWWLDPRAITHASQERFVNQVSFIQVRGEDYELFERNLDLLTTVECQKIDAAFERQDPAIEQVLGRDALAAEVVDDQCATV